MPSESVTADFVAGYDLILTPTLRSARTVETASPSLRVLAWNAWTASLWQELVLAGMEDRILLNEAQTSAVWEQVLSDIGPAILRPVRSIVQLCSTAHRLACGYGALPRLLSYADEAESDTGAFALWLQEFSRRCHQKRWLPTAELEGAAAAAVRSGGFVNGACKRCLLYGFDPLLPVQEELLTALEATGTRFDRRPATAEGFDLETAAGLPGAGPPVLTACANVEAEFRYLAHSLKASLAEGCSSLSVILPNLSEVRGKLERELRTCFFSDTWDDDPQAAKALWEFSEGVPLGSVPLVREALTLLHWLTESQSPEAVSQVLRSPFFQLGIGLEEAAEFDAYLLRDGERLQPEWTLQALAHRAERRAPLLAASLHALHKHAPAAYERRGHSEWVEAVQAVLKTAGWPGTRERTTVEFQTVDRWNDLLDLMISLDAVSPALPFAGFLRTLRHLAETTLFSPQNTGAPIQIMSPSECEGSTAEAVFFACASEEQWTGRRSPHPLLSFSLQKEFGTPGTDALRDDASASFVTERIVQSGRRVEFSYSVAGEDKSVRPSTLVTRLQGLEHQTLPLDAPEAAHFELESIVDDEPLPSLPDSTVSGGVSILQYQAACAFRAFAERRLFSSELGTVDLGMEPRERGSVLHTALQKFWQAVGSQKNLHRHQQDQTLEEEIEHAVDAARPQHAHPDRWAEAYLSIQRERLVRLMRSWLLYEAERPPFTVLHTEHEVKDVAVGPLRMNLRVDRIDEVDDNGQTATVLIDYKTGSPDMQGWLGERPAEPQLPLYATAAGFENVQAIAFATVKPGRKNLGLKTFPYGSPLLFHGAKEKDELAFEHQLPEWRDTLQRLASDFADGRADVGPKEYPSTCQWCAQRMLCRLNPEVLEELSEEEEDAEVSS